MRMTLLLLARFSISGRAAFLLLTSSFIFAPMLPAQTAVVAHRGFSAIAPENTLIAFEQAIACGADYFELDVQRSRSGSAIVIHDETVDRTASDGSTGAIAAMNDRTVAQTRVGFSSQFGDAFVDEKIPTLREALTLAKGRIAVCIEIKARNLEAEVLSIVEELEMIDEVIIFSFDADILKEIRNLNSQIPILFLEETATPLTFATAVSLRAQAIGVGGKTEITPEFLTEARRNGLEVWQWTVNDPVEMKRLIGIGIDGIITNHPDQALRLIGE